MKRIWKQLRSREKQRKVIEKQREKQVEASNLKNNQEPIEDFSSRKEVINEIKLVTDSQEKLIRKIILYIDLKVKTNLPHCKIFKTGKR